MTIKFLIKRLVDLLVSAGLIILLTPLWILLCLLIKLDSRGPVLYKAVRVGKDGVIFRMWKFRTMEDGADSKGPALTEDEDPRITSIGSVLRRLSIDELPQLWNVFRGEMSIVGPRPEIPEIVETYSTNQRAALSVYPGITGLSQINGRDDLPVDEKVGFDLQYVRDYSLLLDVKIVLKTVPAILSGRGNRF